MNKPDANEVAALMLATSSGSTEDYLRQLEELKKLFDGNIPPDLDPTNSKSTVSDLIIEGLKQKALEAINSPKKHQPTVREGYLLELNGPTLPNGKYTKQGIIDYLWGIGVNIEKFEWQTTFTGEILIATETNTIIATRNAEGFYQFTPSDQYTITEYLKGYFSNTYYLKQGPSKSITERLTGSSTKSTPNQESEFQQMFTDKNEVLEYLKTHNVDTDKLEWKYDTIIRSWYLYIKGTTKFIAIQDYQTGQFKFIQGVNHALKDLKITQTKTATS